MHGHGNTCYETIASAIADIYVCRHCLFRCLECEQIIFRHLELALSELYYLKLSSTYLRAAQQSKVKKDLFLFFSENTVIRMPGNWTIVS